MCALEFSEIGVVRLVDVSEPEAKDGEVIVEIDAAGVCGSDIHGIHGGFMRVPPLIMGHELTGTVDGRRVAVNPLISCRECGLCRSGDDQLCRERRIIGIHVAGGFAERVAVPASSLVEVPADMSASAAALIEPLAVSLRGWRHGSATPDSRVAILGAGSIGLGVLAAALIDHVAVTVVDLSRARLATAERIGAGHVTTDLEGEFDVIIDAVGAEATHRASVARLAPQGTAVWIGNVSDIAGFDAREIVRGEQVLRGSFAYSSTDFKDAAVLAQSVDTDWVESRALAEAVEVFASVGAGEAAAIKYQFVP